MKKLLRAAALLLVLAGCNRNQTAPGPRPVQSVTPVPRLAMDKRLAMLHPKGRVEKLTSGQPGEFYAIKKNGKPTGRAALVKFRNAKDKELQLLVMTGPNGKLTRVVAGLPNSAGQTQQIFDLNAFLRGFIGKGGAELKKYSVPKNVEKVTAANALEAVKGALEELGKPGGKVGK